MALFKVWQHNLTDLECDHVNNVGWSDAASNSIRVHSYLEVTNKGGEGYEPGYFQFYKLVMVVAADDLEEVFRVTNDTGYDEVMINLNEEYHHSLSVGDILEDQQGNLFMCDKFGFAKIEK